MEEIKVNARKFIEEHFKIVDKHNQIIGLRFNEAQEIIYNKIRERKLKKKPCWILVLKARQMGMSTFTEALGTEQVITKPNSSMVIIAHEEKASNQLYRMTHRYYSNLPEWFKKMVGIVKDNQTLMQFTNDSTVQVMVASANSEGTGRGQTISYAHLSEFDWWKGDALGILNGVLSACTEDSIVIVETTAHGCANFKMLWDRAVAKQVKGEDDGWIPMFFAWWQDKSYVSEYNGFELTVEEEELKNKFNLTNEQLAWRRKTIEMECLGDINKFHQEFPSSPEEAFISTGDCVFDLNQINNRKYEIMHINNIYDKGYYLYQVEYDYIANERKLYDIKWVSDFRNGCITKYKQVEERHPYSMAIDPSGDGSDYTAIQILDNRSCEQVCVLHKTKMDAFDISCQAYCLGKEYNDSLLASETNFAPSVMTTIKELGYENCYLMESEANRLDKRIEKKIGFRTTTITRPYLITLLIDYVNKHTDKINDYETLIEAENFVRIFKTIDGVTKEKSQANIGSHDDLIMSLGIALYIRESGQAEFELKEKPEEDKPKLWFDVVMGTQDLMEEKEEEDEITYD